MHLASDRPVPLTTSTPLCNVGLQLPRDALVEGFGYARGLGVDVDRRQLLLDLRDVLLCVLYERVHLRARSVCRQQASVLLRQLPHLW